LALRWLAAGERHQPRLLLSVELSVVVALWRRAAVEGRRQALLEVLLAHP